jgi:non-specific protein-tyrosine kinase
MELRQYAAILVKWFWLILLGTLLAGGTAFLASQAMTPVYQASATLMVSQGSTPTISDYTSVLTGQQLAKTYGELLKKRPVLEAVIQELNLPMTVEELGKLETVQLVRDTQLIVLQFEHPNPDLAAKIANQTAKEFIEQNQANQMSRFASSKDNLLKQLKQLEADMANDQASLERARAAAPVNAAEVARLETTLAQDRSSYSSLLKSYEDLRISEAKALDNVMVVEPADIPARPVRPNILLNTLLAAVVGAMLAVGVAFLIEYLDDSIHSPEEVDGMLHLPVLGTIVKVSEANPPDRLTVQNDPRSPVAEAYRALRTNVQLSNVDQPAKVILVTSANPLEGKSTMAANLAVAMAQTGLSVVLVDADMRRPVLHRVFEVPNTNGLTTALLSEQVSLNGSLCKTKVDNLSLIPTGPLPPNPSELLGSRRMLRLITVLREQYDAVIIDSPPVLAVTDPAVLATQVDGVIVVVSAGETRRDAAQQAVNNLQQVGARLLGVALNKIPRNGRGYGYTYYYYYYSSTGEKKRSRRLGPRQPANEPDQLPSQ